MRIDQVGANVNITSAPAETTTTAANRTESIEQVRPAVESTNTSRQQPSNDMVAVERLEFYQNEAKKVSEENQEDEEQRVIRAIEKANKHIKTYDRRLEFSIHDTTKQIMVKVINTEDDSTIREIPSEKILDMVAHLWEMAGILVDEKR